MYRENTVHDLRQRLNNGYIVTEVDPDAPTRQKKHLSDLDEVSCTIITLLYYVYLER